MLSSRSVVIVCIVNRQLIETLSISHYMVSVPLRGFSDPTDAIILSDDNRVDYRHFLYLQFLSEIDFLHLSCAVGTQYVRRRN